MDLNVFAKAISEYQSFVDKETELYTKRMLEAQQKLVATLNQNAEKPQSDIREMYDDVMEVSKKDYLKLQEYIELIKPTHPEVPNL